MEKVDLVLRLLRESEDARWVAQQIESSLAQGISMSVKKAITDGRFLELVPPVGLSKGEQRKREKYETTRPYTDAEKEELVATALKAVFIDLPAIQAAGMKGLRELGADFGTIEFLPPGELEQGQPAYSKSTAEVEAHESSFRDRIEKFLSEFLR